MTKVAEIVNDYESKISSTILDAKGRIETITAEYAADVSTRQACQESLQEVLFSVESNYTAALTDQFGDYYETLKAKELSYKADTQSRVAELLAALEETKVLSPMVTRWSQLL